MHPFQPILQSHEQLILDLQTSLAADQTNTIIKYLVTKKMKYSN